MNEQLSLAGMDVTSPPTDRLFFAVFPDVSAAAHIAHLAQQLRIAHDLSGKPLPTERFHVTLHLVGDYHGLPEGVVAAAKEAAATVAVPPFDVTFDRAQSFASKPRNRPFVLLGGEGVTKLKAFQLTLFSALKKSGLVSRAETNFNPHVTLLYDDRAVTEQPVEAVRWTVREFVLVHSLLGQTRHIPLARWPLKS